MICQCPMYCNVHPGPMFDDYRQDLTSTPTSVTYIDPPPAGFQVELLTSQTQIQPSLPWALSDHNVKKDDQNWTMHSLPDQYSPSFEQSSSDGQSSAGSMNPYSNPGYNAGDDAFVETPYIAPQVLPELMGSMPPAMEVIRLSPWPGNTSPGFVPQYTPTWSQFGSPPSSYDSRPMTLAASQVRDAPPPYGSGSAFLISYPEAPIQHQGENLGCAQYTVPIHPGLREQTAATVTTPDSPRAVENWGCPAAKCSSKVNRRSYNEIQQHIDEEHLGRGLSPIEGQPCKIPNCDKVFWTPGQLKRHVSGPHSRLWNSTKRKCFQKNCTVMCKSRADYRKHYWKFHTETRKAPWECSNKGCHKQGTNGFSRHEHLQTHEKTCQYRGNDAAATANGSSHDD